MVKPYKLTFIAHLTVNCALKMTQIALLLQNLLMALVWDTTSYSE